MANALSLLADPAEASTAAGGSPHLPPSTRELKLFPEWSPGRSRRSWGAIFAVSIALHLALFVAVVRIPAPVHPVENHEIVFQHVLLYLPPSLMTQKAPNHKKVTKHIDLPDLLAKEHSPARRAAPAPSRRRFELPKEVPVRQPGTKGGQTLPNAPQLAVNRPPAPLTGLPNSPIAPAPPRPESPPNPFENVGTEAPPSGKPKLVPPSASVQAEINDLRQHRNSQHLTISDDRQSVPMPGSPWSPSVNGGPHSAVELQSDPRGADFRPYLARILAIVRANWRRVIPESAQMGQLRGRTVIEFIIDRDGSIPKLVMSDSSGSEPLDRAAVAGLSMSNPLPPLPADFKGFQVRLAFTFAYNMTSQ